MHFLVWFKTQHTLFIECYQQTGSK